MLQKTARSAPATLAAGAPAARIATGVILAASVATGSRVGADASLKPPWTWVRVVGGQPASGAHEDVRGGRFYGSGRTPRLEAGQTAVWGGVGAGRCVRTECLAVAHVA